jgi:hypothetical protein
VSASSEQRRWRHHDHDVHDNHHVDDDDNVADHDYDAAKESQADA